MVKLTGIILLSVFIMASCGKKCKDAEDNARTKSKNAALMYIWRFTDNLIVKKSNTMNSDSGFISFKPNGDFTNGASLKDLKAVPDIWYVNNDIIIKTYCTDNFPENKNFSKYFIKNDTLFLNFYSDINVIPVAKTYVHYWKY